MRSFAYAQDDMSYCCCCFCSSWPQPFFSASKNEANTLRMVLSAMSRVMNTTRLLRSSPSGQASSVAGGWKTCCTPWITTGLSVSLTFRMALDRESTRLHSSHTVVSYAVFCVGKTSDDGDDLAS